MDYISGKTTQKTVTLNLNQYNDGEPTAARLTADRSGVIIDDQQEDWLIAIDSFRLSTQNSLYYKNVGLEDCGLVITARSLNSEYTPHTSTNNAKTHFRPDAFSIGPLGSNLPLYVADTVSPEDYNIPMIHNLSWDEQINPFGSNGRPLWATNVKATSSHELFYGLDDVGAGDEFRDLIQITDAVVLDVDRDPSSTLYRPYGSQQGWLTHLDVGVHKTYHSGDMIEFQYGMLPADWDSLGISDDEWVNKYGVLTDDIFVFVGPGLTPEYMQLTDQEIWHPDHSEAGNVKLIMEFKVALSGGDFYDHYPSFPDADKRVNDNANVVHIDDEPVTIRWNQNFNAILTCYRSPMGYGSSPHVLGDRLYNASLPDNSWYREYHFDPFKTWGTTYHALAANVNDFIKFYTASEGQIREMHTVVTQNVTLPPALKDFYKLCVTPDGRFMIQLDQQGEFFVDLRIGNSLWNHLGFSGTTHNFKELEVPDNDLHPNNFIFRQFTGNKFQNKGGNEDTWIAHSLPDGCRIISEFPCVELGAHFKNIRITSSDLHFVPEQTEGDSTERILAS